jgi:hypothetical protein
MTARFQVRFQPSLIFLEADQSNLLQNRSIRFNAYSIFSYEVAYELSQFQGLKTAQEAPSQPTPNTRTARYLGEEL